MKSRVEQIIFLNSQTGIPAFVLMVSTMEHLLFRKFRPQKTFFTVQCEILFRTLPSVIKFKIIVI